MRELRARSVTSVYGLRGSELKAVIRHPLVDTVVLAEVFRDGEYALAPRVRERLAALGREPRVLDLGGNIGLFALWLRHELGAMRVTSFEPDPRNIESLRRCIVVNQLADSWRVVEAAAGTSDGRARFISDFTVSQLASVPEQAGEEHKAWSSWMPIKRGLESAQPIEVDVEVKDVFGDMEQCDLLKIDIEGAEWALLADPRFTDVAADVLVIEAHYSACPDPDPPGHLVKKLECAGFELESAPTPRPDGTTTVWATRSPERRHVARL
jgi:FkbM family methyltransferase